MVSGFLDARHGITDAKRPQMRSKTFIAGLRSASFAGEGIAMPSPTDSRTPRSSSPHERMQRHRIARDGSIVDCADQIGTELDGVVDAVQAAG
jgi:hypothetical protein